MANNTSDRRSKAVGLGKQQNQQLPEDEVAPVIPPCINIDLTGRVLVGKLVTDKQMNMLSVQNAIWRMWEGYNLTHIAMTTNNIMVFTFQTQEFAKRVITRSPWCVYNQLLSLQTNATNKRYSEVNFDIIPFWIQIDGLPLSLMNNETLNALAVRVGHVLEVENPIVEGRLLRTFARVWVGVDVSKPVWAESQETLYGIHYHFGLKPV